MSLNLNLTTLSKMSKAKLIAIAEEWDVKGADFSMTAKELAQLIVDAVAAAEAAQVEEPIDTAAERAELKEALEPHASLDKPDPISDPEVTPEEVAVAKEKAKERAELTEAERQVEIAALLDRLASLPAGDRAKRTIRAALRAYGYRLSAQPGYRTKKEEPDAEPPAEAAQDDKPAEE